MSGAVKILLNMKNKHFLPNALRNLTGVAAVLLVSLLSLSCGDFDNKNYNTLVRRTPGESKNTNTNDKSPSPSTSASASPASSMENNSTNSESPKSQSYQDNLPAGFQFPTDAVGKRILSEYGAVYVARGGVTPPPTVMFASDSECSSWQSGLSISRANVGGKNLELQAPAMKALQEAIAEAKGAGESITPRDTDSARRSYSETVELWASRVNPALTHWVGKGRITQQEASRIKALSPSAQVSEVLRLEEQGIFFSKDLSKSILYSVAAPGTSQHLSMLALDVNENENPKVREILAKHGWYQTVVSDLPHFTYLGLAESELPKLGLKKTSNGGRNFWIPAL